ERGLAQHLFIDGQQGLGVGYLRLVCQRRKILGADRINHASAHIERVHGDDVGGLLCGLVEIEVGQVEEDLVCAELRAGGVYFHNLVDGPGREAEGGKRRGLESHGGQVEFERVGV